MPVLRLAVDTTPASLMETILQEVRTHHVKGVLNSHTHKHPGGSVCGPLESLLDTRWDKHTCVHGCSLRLDASFKKGDGRTVGPFQVEGMPSQKEAIKAVCCEALRVLLLRDTDATHLAPGHFKYGLESIRRIRAAARYEQTSPNTAATGALQPQVNVAARARQQPTTHAVPLAPPAQQRPEPQQQSASQCLQPEPPPMGTALARTAPAQKQPREPQKQPARTAPVVQQQPPMLEQPQPATPVAPQQLQAQGPKICVSPHVGPAGGTASPGTSASGGDRGWHSEHWNWGSEHWNWGWHSAYSDWGRLPKCHKCLAQRHWQSADTHGTFKLCHHCWGQSKSHVHWVAVCPCGSVECEHCVSGWQGDTKCEAIWAATKPSNTFMRHCTGNLRQFHQSQWSRGDG